MNSPATSYQRLHDLDALRAAAVLIGIFYHASLLFARGFPWMDGTGCGTGSMAVCFPADLSFPGALYMGG